MTSMAVTGAARGAWAVTAGIMAVSFLLNAWPVGPGPALAQDNGKIPVYGSETVAPGQTMLKLHSNTADSDTGELGGAGGPEPLAGGWLSTACVLPRYMDP